MAKQNYDEHIAELNLKSRLIEIKNKAYSEIDTLIWNKRKLFSDWKAQKEAINSALTKVMDEMSILIEEFCAKKLEKEKIK